ncbi:hypothetical protein ELS19_05075 [Halogeometricum borinquense]|uniref:Phage repressor protein n=1 Tax=Halogeometricum borinquense TaxID=60847 RepID=A0A482TDV3_9EURY|nr:hypothetical protein [Halogeometricum borinquense]RYJ13398.1 hypothetical protein ELS19_05075 [Halogeometricum borinquense]
MRQRPPWASKYDDPILEFLQETDAALPPAVVEFNLDRKNIASPAYSTVKRRMRKLAKHGLLNNLEEKEGYYEITDKGRDYLNAELDISELTEDNSPYE